VSQPVIPTDTVHQPGGEGPHVSKPDVSKLRVAVLDDYQKVAPSFGPWDDLDAEVTFFSDHLGDPDALVERLAPFEVIVAMRERTAFPAPVLERLSALRLLVTTGMGNASIDLGAAHDLGIVVSGTAGTGEPTAEMTWALILGLARHIAEEDREIRQGRWQTTVGTDLHGATLGVIGLGRLGSQVAAVGQAFGMRVVAWSQHLQAATAAKVGVEAVSKEELFATADIVTVHLVLSDRSRGLVSAEDLARMKPTAYLVNTSRGPIVDEAALIEVLRAERIAGAALDVFSVEPLPLDHPYRSTPRTLLSPHLGYVTEGTYRIFFREAVADIAAFAAGSPVRVLNP
jgi:phosphoglycerate dehydrogenase-like enzyme